MWELQQHMHSWIVPSIWVQYEELGRKWLNQRYADQRWDEETDIEGYNKLELEASEIGEDSLIQLIADKAIEFDSTTNGGHEVYLDSWTCIPFCFED